jgi:hypothetical protein
MMRGLCRIMVASATIAAIAGCSDSTTSPNNMSSRTVRATDRPSLDYSGPLHFSGYRTSTIVLTSAAGTFNIGNGFYTLSVPANAVCVLGSSYGPDEWDKPCTTLANNESIQVTATIGFANGGPVVDFSPGLRFSPDAQVTLSTSMYAPILVPLRDYFAANPSALRNFGIYYTPDLGMTDRTDAAFDPSVVTHINLQSGLIWRRVKHFSGYNVVAGMPCDPSPDDPDCVEGPPPTVE